MEIRAEMKMTDIIHLNHLLITVINRFDIAMGFGDKTIQEICEQNQIDTDFFLQIVNSFHDENYFPRLQYLNFPISRFIEYLRRAHADYLYRNIPAIENLLVRLANSYQGEQAHITFLQKFFTEYKNELVIHINREEQRVFPYVIDLEFAYNRLEISESLHDRIKQYSIEDYFEEHNDVEEKLYDLKNILIKYFPTGGDIHLKEDLVHLLFSLEKDLNRHSLMEDKVLVPKVAMIERELMLLYQARKTENFKAKISESSDIRSQLREKFAEISEADHSDLSKREKEIIREIALGLTSKEIADKLFISLHTVLTHRKNINRKLGIKTASGITVYAIINGIVSPDEIS
jgi:regulator of cell morphogenesis and NO signaling